MAEHNDLGKVGENLAAAYLQREGYDILESNWRHRRAEIDLIAKQEEVLIFVEVKTRSKDFLNQAERAFDQKKKGMIANAASVYMEQIGHDWELRFDLIVVIYSGEENHTIRHYKDAFFPGL